MKSTLYQYAVCPFCLKVKAGLALKGADYEAVEVHPLNKKEIAFSPDYRRVPIYVDGKGKQVNESTDILRHLDEEFGGEPLVHGDEKEKKWLDWSERYVKALPPAIYDTFPNALKAFAYITKEGKFSWVQKRIIKFSGAAVMTMVAKKSRKKQGIEDPTEFVKKMAAEWEEGLSNNAFMGGDKPNAADVSVYGYSKSLAGLPAEEALRQVPGFWAWYGRMAEKTATRP